MTAIRFLLVCLLSMTLIGCDRGAGPDLTAELEAKNQTIKELEQTIQALEEETRALQNQIARGIEDIQALQNEIDRSKMEQELFAAMSNLAYQFVQAHTSGNREEIEKFLDSGLTLTEKDQDLYVTYTVAGEELEVQLYREDSPYVYKDMLIQGFHYDPDAGIYRLHIREFYEHPDPQQVFLPTFLNLTFQQTGDGWKIILIEFDV